MTDSPILRAGLRRRAIATLSFVVAGAIAAPALVYAFGSLLGPYEGPNGFGGFLTDVYGDALHGRLAAIGLLLSPAAYVLCWWLIILVWRHSRK